MEKFFRTTALVAALMATLSLVSCKNDDDNMTVGPSAQGQSIDLGDGSNGYEINSDITLTYPNTYNLKGFVYVTSGNTITIEPGVLIKGDGESKGTLIIERGAKIIARGTAQNPIVFTSSKAPGMRKPGDWGGLIILGKATNNQGEMTIEGGVRSNHGGTDDADNSGILSYVRVEFAGIEYAIDNEINGITFGSVGSGTTVDHVQVSYSGDDSFEWFGGKVNAKYLVALATWDDDFDTDNGYQGKLQFLVGLRNPLIADKSSSNGFESDNCSAGTPVAPYTRPVFANVSLFGPIDNPDTYSDKGNTNGSEMGIFQTGVQIRRSSQLNLFNSVIAGYPIGLIIENDKSGSLTQENATAGYCNVSGCVLAGMRKNFQDKARNPKDRSDVINASDLGTFVSAYWSQSSNDVPLASIDALSLQGNPLDLNNPNFCPSQSSILASGAIWTNSNVSDSFFTKTTYRGAFSPSESIGNNWMTGWTNFDPQNTIY